MGIDAISPYQTNTGNTARSTGGKNLSMDDFFKLMVTQLSNQSILLRKWLSILWCRR